MSSDSTTRTHRAGFVALLGRPNVGKSTLLNALLGEKLVIVTPKPQTTRDRILGICAVPDGQLAFLDTPGVHRTRGVALNVRLREVAIATIADADVVVHVIDARSRQDGGLHRDDQAIVDTLRQANTPAIAALNKIDLVKKPQLLPLMELLAGLGCYKTLVPISATRGMGLQPLLEEARLCVPEGPALFAEDDLTDKPVRFLVGELLREQLMLELKDELPYSVAVEITAYKARPDGKLIEIDATIHVERASQKGIVLGKGGERLKNMATASRAEIEALVGCQVYLRTHVRVEPNWTSSEKKMRKLGYAPAGHDKPRKGRSGKGKR